MSFCFFPGVVIGAKFEQHHYNISRDIHHFVIYLCTETICDLIILFVFFFFCINLIISGTREDIQKEKTPFLFPLEGLLEKGISSYVLLHVGLEFGKSALHCYVF